MTEEVRLSLVGASGVGKSSLTLQFTQNRFIEEYDPTSETGKYQFNSDFTAVEDSYRKQVTVDGRPVLVDLFDTAGREEYSPMRDSYIQASRGIVIVYCIERKDSLEEAKYWYERNIDRLFDQSEVEQLAFVVAGNKCDLESQRQVSYEEGLQFAREIGASFFETSAKTRQNVQEAIYELVREVRKKRKETNPPEKKRGFKAVLKSVFRLNL